MVILQKKFMNFRAMTTLLVISDKGLDEGHNGGVEKDDGGTVKGKNEFTGSKEEKAWIDAFLSWIQVAPVLSHSFRRKKILQEKATTCLSPGDQKSSLQNSRQNPKTFEVNQ